MRLGDGDDRMEDFGEDGHDTVYGGAGNDHIDGLIGDDRLIGGDGDDWLRAGFGNDTLRGGDGNDTLLGGGDRDVLIGGLGADVFVYSEDETYTTMGGSQLMTIRDFTSGEDLLVVSDNEGFDPRTPQDALAYFLSTAQDHSLGLLWEDMFGGRIILRGLTMADLQAGDVTTINDPTLPFLG